MANKSHRVMIEGTEGKPDYLVVARSKGYVLGFKPLIHMTMDNGKYGCRLRLQAAPSDIPPAHTEAQLQSMAEAFPNIPWQKRSGTRFSTMLVKDLPWGIEYADEALKALQNDIPELFNDIEKVMGEVKYLNREDAEAFALEVYSGAFAELKEAYLHYLSKQGKQIDPQDGEIVTFPGKESPQDV